MASSPRNISFFFAYWCFLINNILCWQIYFQMDGFFIKFFLLLYEKISPYHGLKIRIELKCKLINIHNQWKINRKTFFYIFSESINIKNRILFWIVSAYQLKIIFLDIYFLFLLRRETKNATTKKKKKMSSFY